MKEYDITKGFTYMYFDGDVDWAFGYGLSYTAFDYSNMSITGTIPAGPLTVTAEIRNAGTRAGDEVVQLYVRDVEASVKRPKKQLMGFERISLAPGETRKVSFTLSPERLAFWDQKRKASILEPGAFEAIVGDVLRRRAPREESEASTPAQWTPAEVMRMLPRGSQN